MRNPVRAANGAHADHTAIARHALNVWIGAQIDCALCIAERDEAHRVQQIPLPVGAIEHDGCIAADGEQSRRTAVFAGSVALAAELLCGGFVSAEEQQTLMPIDDEYPAVAEFSDSDDLA